jgi:ribosomal protein S18 acetylase RimI-like enzyme
MTLVQGRQVNLNIAVAANADRDTALAILLDAARRQARHRTSAWGADELAETVDRALLHGELYLARRSGVAVGAFVLQWADSFHWGERADDAGYVHKLAVREDAAGGGVGRQILRWAEERVRGAGRDFVRLDCDADNPRLNAYYRDAGFVLQGTLLRADGLRMNLYEKPMG